MQHSLILPLVYSPHTSGRLRQSTLDYWREYLSSNTRPQNLQASQPPVVILAVAVLDGLAVCASGVLINLDGGTTEHNFTVTHKDYRRQGYGHSMQMAKLTAVRSYGITPYVTVASDNLASIALCNKSGLAVVESKTLFRQGGGEAYQALIFS